MSEIAKLRQRLSNINKTVREYKMSVIEAKALITEIDLLKSEITELTKPKVAEIDQPHVIVKVMDGGTF